MFPLDNDWGDGVDQSYPALKSSAASKRTKRQKELHKLVAGTVILEPTSQKQEGESRKAKNTAKEAEEETSPNEPVRQAKKRKKESKLKTSPVSAEQKTNAAEESRAEKSSSKSQKRHRDSEPLQQPLEEITVKPIEPEQCPSSQKTSAARLKKKARKDSQAVVPAPEKLAKKSSSRKQKAVSRTEVEQAAAEAALVNSKAPPPLAAPSLSKKRQSALDALQQRVQAGRGLANPQGELTAKSGPLSKPVKHQKDGIRDPSSSVDADAAGSDSSSAGIKTLSETAGLEKVRSHQMAKATKLEYKKSSSKSSKAFSGESRKEAEQSKEGDENPGKATKSEPLGEISGGLLGKLATRLTGSRFRWLNETMYTSKGEDAFALVNEQPELFELYHEGFQQQTKNWPEQPVKAAIKWLQSQAPNLRVADFGCGDAALALAVPQKVACLDLVESKPGVIACNMSDTPLETSSMDVAVFCLALMGTDYPAFLREATRVLKPRGHLWIAEVRSRFVTDGQEDFRPFLSALSSLGYKLVQQNASNKMFVVFVLQRTGSKGAFEGIQWPELKPCLYKKR